MRSVSAQRGSSAPGGSLEGGLSSEAEQLVLSVLKKARGKSGKGKKPSETEKRLMQRYAVFMLF
jgi:hypothetical protein